MTPTERLDEPKYCAACAEDKPHECPLVSGCQCCDLTAGEIKLGIR